MTLVDKKIFGYGGASGANSGGAIASSVLGLNGDNPDIHFKDTLKGGGWIGNQKLIRILVEEAQDRIFELQRYGNIFTRGRDGRPITLRPGGHSRDRAFVPIHMWTVAEEAQRRGVRVFNETMITSIITYEGTVIGATGIDIRTGEFYVFRAKSTILTSGGVGQIYGYSSVAAISTNPVESTGDGYAMAYKIGAELVDMEFQQFLVAMSYPPVIRGCYPAASAARKDSLCDKDRNFWMREIPMAEMTRARLIKEVLSKIEEGKGSPHGGIWADFGVLESFMKDTPHYLITYSIKEVPPKFGMDYRKEMFELGPSFHHMMGGVVINEKCETTVPGLYACGEVTGGVHGGNRLGTNALIDCLVFGKRAGECAAERALKIERLGIDWKQVDVEHRRVYNILERVPEKPLKSYEVRRKIQRVMLEKAGPFRTQKDIEQALKELEKMKEEELPRMYVDSKTRTYNVGWIEALETFNMIDVAEIILRSTLKRTESREAHQRRDYPETDDENWLVNVYVKQDKGAMVVYERPIIAPEIPQEIIRKGRL